jgi:hypothetical protein
MRGLRKLSNVGSYYTQKGETTEAGNPDFDDTW